MNSKVIEVDCSTGEQVEREMTDEEISLKKMMEEESIRYQQSLIEIESNKKSAIEKLSSLGLTEEEIQALVG